MEIRKKQGFTLLELLVVFAIIAVLVAIALGVVGAAKESSRRRIAETDIALFKLKLNDFRLDNDFIPGSTSIGTEPSEGTTDYEADPTDPAYLAASRRLFLALSGRTTHALVETRDRSVDGKTYVGFDDVKVGDPELDGGAVNPKNRGSYLGDAFTTGSWIKDPWGHPYGFYYDESADIQSLHGKTVFDAWSTGGETANTPEARAKWMTSWGRK